MTTGSREATTSSRSAAEESAHSAVKESMGIGSFLRTRRADLAPETLGLAPTLNRRRVPGLRREEVAQLAGISVDYYIRIEQGRAVGISEPVLDALARALRLTDDERTYLGNLADPSFPAGTLSPPVVRPQMQWVLDAMDPVTPAYIVGPGLDYLAWNRVGARFAYDLDALAPERRNAALLVFLHPDSRALHPEWDAVAAETVAALRAETGRHPCHPRVKAVTAELLNRSAEFSALWEAQQVRETMSGTKRVRHPGVGDIEVAYETFALTTDESQMLCVYTVEPDSPSQAALSRLAAPDRTHGVAESA
ncbi:helix-turn-helix transcriptional regulator [Streptomyces iconiensis]|uniref:Helix-turn-helix transcriptional regulator n=1 Tax=Streptomyces iconiensis TaxID=1384038 RepID=A0ABT6ZYH4_9ACTN|nr:helix-turn-helix transcriptional regulator [Streptomyces iconiensis]MDJ1134119.1 helix-turn-helix transcriptional regulator [Streptomyces iconiensis]